MFRGWKKSACVLLVVLTVFVLSFSLAMAKEEKEVRIGTLIPLTGPLSVLGINAKYGSDLAAAEINDAGGIKSMGGAKIKLVHGDSEGKADTGISVAERLVKQQKVSACMSGPQSGVTFATTQITEKYQIPHMVTGSVADEITSRGFKYVFRIEPTATSWSVGQIDMINAMRKKGAAIKSIGLFYEDTLWGQSQAKVWREKKGDLVIAADLSYPNGTSDLTVAISKLKAAKPDVVLTCSYVSDAILMMKTMFEMDFNTQAILGSGAGPEDPLFQKNLGPLAENIITISQFTKELNPFCKNLDQKYTKIFNQPMGGHSGMCYAGIYTLADAINRAGSGDPQKIREALVKTNLCSGPAKDVLPVKCIKFDQTGQLNFAPIEVQWKGDRLLPVFPDEFAAAKIVWPMPTWKQRGLKK